MGIGISGVLFEKALIKLNPLVKTVGFAENATQLIGNVLKKRTLPDSLFVLINSVFYPARTYIQISEK